MIVCGYGRFGRVVAEELRRNGMTIVAIDSAEEREPELMRAGALYVIGSALDEQLLEQAAIGSASDIVVATPSDPDNVYISLSARAKNPRIRIHARAESDIGLKHLELAGRRSGDLVIPMERDAHRQRDRASRGDRFS